MDRNFSKRLTLITTSLVGLLICATSFLSGQGGPAQPRPKTDSPSIDLHAAKSIGSKSAPITLEVFSDYQCPFCRAFYLDQTQQVIKNYVDTGKVYLVFHDFPWDFHAHSMEAARLANAAAEIGKFKEVEGALYTTQDSWEASGKIEDALAPVLSAAQLKRVEALKSRPEIQSAIDEDIRLAKQRNLLETPSIY
ncbi:MAG TPA: thioredoxin domain-containing protein, partial [Candidatus Acidoferrum sp.]|nr:thioredoxin domain-containing protein [Candidatus Acidoferrum sp.]